MILADEIADQDARLLLLTDLSGEGGFSLLLRLCPF
jgi:hypothetical protein